MKSDNGDSVALESWSGRMKAGAIRSGIYSCIGMLVILAVVGLIMNYREGDSVAAHVLGTLIKAGVGAATLGAAVWFAMFQVAQRRERDALKALNAGVSVKATCDGNVQLIGDTFMSRGVGGAVGAMWRPLAPLVANRIPVHQVFLRVDIDGKTHRLPEALFADEVEAIAGAKSIRVVVDPERPMSRHWLVRPIGGEARGEVSVAA